MSLGDDIKTAIQKELGTPEARAAIENLESIALNTVFRAINALVPGFVMAIAGGVINAVEQKGIDAVKGFTDHELLQLAGGGFSLIKEYPTPNSDQIHTKEDLLKAVPELAAERAKIMADFGIKE